MTFYEHLVQAKGNCAKAQNAYERERGWRGDEWYIECHPPTNSACRPDSPWRAAGNRPCWPCEKRERAGLLKFPNLSDEVGEAVLRFEREHTTRS